jgi:hypothetical protein
MDFFGGELGSIDHLDPNLLSSDDPSTTTHLSKETYRFLAYLDLASRSNSGQESAVDDLAKSTLEVTGFDELAQSFARATTSLLPYAEIPIERHGVMYVSSTSTP